MLKKARAIAPIVTNRPTKNSNLYLLISELEITDRAFSFAVNELVDHGVWRRSYGFRGFHSDDFPLIEHRDFLDNPKNLRDFVGNQDARKIESLVDGIEKLQDGIDRKRVKPGGRFVKEDDLRGAHQSAGKRRSTRIRHGAPWLKTVLVQAAWAGSRKRESYLRAQFLRLKGRRGAKKAIMAVAASMLTAAYFMLRDGVEYHDLGAGHFDQRDRIKVANRLIRRLEELGLKVQVEAVA